jgi:hypothetical protein
MEQQEQNQNQDHIRPERALQGDRAHIFTDYINEHACLEFGQYEHGGTALVLRAVDGEMLAVASVNLHHTLGTRALAEDELYIKSYSENSGMEEALIECGIIEPTPLSSFHSGFVSVRAYRLTPAANELRKVQGAARGSLQP